jgi:hypothetical protein
VLFVLSLLSLPALSFYWGGSAYPSAKRSLDVKASSGMAGTDGPSPRFLYGDGG